MRYIGSKKDLLGFIEKPLIDHGIEKSRICDIFSGSVAVAKHFKQKDYEVISNDNMFYSYVFQQAYIENDNPYPKFLGLGDIIHNVSLPHVIEFLNNLKGDDEGFMFKNFSKIGSHELEKPRNYLSDFNAKKIDAIRDKIKEWHDDNRLEDKEYYILLSMLIESIPFVSNISGTYGAYLKIDDPRMFKHLSLKIPNLLSNGKGNKCYNEDSNILIKKIETDILYIDPPYNHRQYPSNYHLWETVAVWDKEITDTQTGLRKYDNQKSMFCSKVKCESAFKDLIRHTNANHIMISYSSEGIMSLNTIMNILEEKGKVTHYEHDFRRFKSNSRNDKANHVSEWLFFVEV